jgi:hypothetical protein
MKWNLQGRFWIKKPLEILFMNWRESEWNEGYIVKFMTATIMPCISKSAPEEIWNRVQFLLEASNLSLLHIIQTDTVAHPTPYPMGTRGSFIRSKVDTAWSWPLTSI